MNNQDTDYVNFGDIARGRLEQQCQYASRYIWGEIPGYPNLSNGLRFLGSAEDYHSIEIHNDDVGEFIRRYKEFLEDRMLMKYEQLKKKYNIKDE